MRFYFTQKTDNLRSISACDSVELKLINESLVGVVGLTADDVHSRQQLGRQSVLIRPYA
jgi:hypothetical protein